MSDINTNKIQNKLIIVSILSLCIYLIVWLCSSLEWIFSPGMNEYREQAQIDAIAQLSAGNDIYPSDAHNKFYLYGPLFPLIGSWVSNIFNISAVLSGRFLSLCLTLFSMGLGAICASKPIEKRNLKMLCALLVCSWISLSWSGDYRGQISPATLGTFLMICALGSASLNNYYSNTASVFFTVAGFYVKSYFIAICAPIFIWLIINNWRKGVFYGLLGLFVLCGSIILIKILSPNYFVYNWLHHLNVSGYNIHHFIRQTFTFIGYWGILPLAFAVASFLCGRKVTNNIWFYASIIWILVYLKLGAHPGAFLSYPLQTFVVTAIIFTAPILCNNINNRYSVIIVFLLSCMIFIHRAPLFPAKYDKKQIEASAHNIRKITDGYAVLNLSPISQFINPDFDNLDNGNTGYLHTLCCTEPSWIDNALLPEMESLNSEAETAEEWVRNIINGGEYKYLLVDKLSAYKDVLDENLVNPIDTFYVCSTRPIHEMILYEIVKNQYIEQ